MAGPAPLTRVALIGVTGRMGQALLRAAPQFPGLIVTGAVASEASLAIGRDAGEVAGVGALNLTVSADVASALRAADVALDFSTAAAAGANLAAARAAGKPLLIGTTGLGGDFAAQLAAATRDIAVLVAPNTSLAVAVLSELAGRAARALADFDVDILEAHHRTKRDAPSGTALALGEAVRAAQGLPQGAVRAAGSAPGPRGSGEIRIESVRAGDLVGEHTLLFSAPGEQLCLSHRASDRAIFARGALKAALWLASRPPGHYAMRDFLFPKTEA